MADKKVNKVVYGGTVLIDLTGDTVTADKVLTGYTTHDKSGETITGTCDYDVNSEDATVAVAEMLIGKTAYARGSKITGTMPNKGAVKESISTKAQEVIIAQGYHDGSGKITISPTEQAKIIATNIRDGVTILGVTGTMSGTEGAKAQAKTVTPKTTVQNVLPDKEYNYLSQVTVNAIPYVESDNAAGGTTVTIG
nr:MAG TPA: tail protein [Caudoviricetes sp.]